MRGKRLFIHDAAEIDNLPAAGWLQQFAETVGRLALRRGKIADDTIHRMDEIESDIKVLGEFCRALRLEEIQLEGVQSFVPLVPVKACLVAHAAEQFVALFEQDGNQAAANVTVGAGNEDLHSLPI